MADSIVNLNAYRRTTTKATHGNDCGEIRAPHRKNAALRQKRNTVATPIFQIPTAANKKRRCEAASQRYREDCEDAITKATVRVLRNPITGVLVVTATDLDGGDFNVMFRGIYSDNPEAALSTLECLAKHFGEKAQELRNERAMAASQPIKRPAFEVAL